MRPSLLISRGGLSLLLLWPSTARAWRTQSHSQLSDKAIESTSSSEYPDIHKYATEIVDGSNGGVLDGFDGEIAAHGGWNEFIESNDGDARSENDGGIIQTRIGQQYRGRKFSGVSFFSFGGSAYFNIGALAHLVQDMASPPHGGNIAHGLPDGFEGYSEAEIGRLSPLLGTPGAGAAPEGFYEVSFLQTRNRLPTWVANIPTSLQTSDDPWPAQEQRWVGNPTYDATALNTRPNRGHYGGGPLSIPAEQRNADIFNKQHSACFTGLGGEVTCFLELIPPDDSIVVEQHAQAVSLVSGMLQAISKKLPPLAKDFAIGGKSDGSAVVGPSGGDISFKVLENRKRDVRLFITLDSAAGPPIISSAYGLDGGGVPLTLDSGISLPWEKNHTIPWDGKLADGSFPSDGEHQLCLQIKDFDGNFSPGTEEVPECTRVSFNIAGSDFPTRMA